MVKVGIVIINISFRLHRREPVPFFPQPNPTDVEPAFAMNVKDTGAAIRHAVAKVRKPA
jgi:hypothetical protein